MTRPTDIQTRLDGLFDYLYANAPTRTPLAIWEEVQKVLRTGIFIEQSRGLSPAFAFTKRESARLLAHDDQIVSLVAWQIRSEYTRSVGQTNSHSDEDNIAFTDQNIAIICQSLSGILLSSSSVDLLGEALEVFRHNWTKRNGGQFFTDPAVTQLAIELLEFDPRVGHHLIDLAAGTGGFLIAAANQIKKQLMIDPESSAVDNIDFATMVTKSLKGVEIDQSLADIANATIGATIGYKHTQFVTVADSLDINDDRKLIESGVQESTYLCAATNPPFGTKITLRDPSILAMYETPFLQHKIRSNIRFGIPSPTSLDILFLERNIRILKPGDGRLAIVLPYQLSSGPQAFPVRQWLLRHAILEAVVDLPSETFQPYTGTKTCLVLLRRRTKPLQDLAAANDGPVFMSVPKWIGHDRRGNPVFRVSSMGIQTDDVLSDMVDVETAYQRFRNGNNPSEFHADSFSVPSQYIYDDSKLRFNARYFQPNALLQAVSIVSDSHHWRSVKLGDVTDGIFFPSRFRRHYVSQSHDAVPFLGGTNISQLVPVVDKWLSKNDPVVEKIQVLPGWLLVTRSGSTGIVASVPTHWSGWAVSEHVIRVIPNSDRLDPSYLEAYLRTKFAKASMLRGVFGSVIDEITPEFLADIEIFVPRSDETYSRVVEAALAANAAREQAIESITEAINLIEQGIEYWSR